MLHMWLRFPDVDLLLMLDNVDVCHNMAWLPTQFFKYARQQHPKGGKKVTH